MVKIMENPIKMDDLGGKPTIFGNTHILRDVPTKHLDLPSFETPGLRRLFCATMARCYGFGRQQRSALVRFLTDTIEKFESCWS